MNDSNRAPIDTLFVGHDELRKGYFRAVFEKPNVTKKTPEDERTVSLSEKQTKDRLQSLVRRGIPCTNTERALKIWPAYRPENPLDCGYMLPKAEAGLMRLDDPLPSCLLEEGHKGEHLIRTSWGQYAVFLPESEPCGEDCECAADTSCTNYECFSWGPISEKAAQKLLNPTKSKSKRRPK